MAKQVQKKEKENLYLLVKKFRTQPKDSSRNKNFYNYTNPVTLRALRIHRHLRALENEILDPNIHHTITIFCDPKTDQIMISIRNDEIHCCRVAYLSPEEFTFLRKNREIVKILSKCRAWKDVA